MDYEDDKTSEKILRGHKSFADQLGISETIYQCSLKLWRATLDFNPELKQDATHWFASMILVTAFNDRIDPDSRLAVNITTLLRKSNMTVVGLLGKLKYLREIVGLSQRSVSLIFDFQRRFCVTSAIFDRLNTVYTDVFVTDDILIDEELGSKYIHEVPETKQACWLLYLLAKDEVPIAHNELFLSFQVLLCCIEFVFTATPKFLHKPLFENALEKEIVEAHSDVTPVLKLLCKQYGCDMTEMTFVKKKLDTSFFVSFMNHTTDDLKCDATTTGIVIPNSHELNARYWEFLDRCFDLDETLFLTKDNLVELQNNRIQSTLQQNTLSKTNKSAALNCASTSLQISLKQLQLSEVESAVKWICEHYNQLLVPLLEQRVSYLDHNTVDVDDILKSTRGLLFGLVESILKNKQLESNGGDHVSLELSEETMVCLLALSLIAIMSDFNQLQQNSEVQVDDELALNVLHVLQISFVSFLCEVDHVYNMDNSFCLISQSMISRLKFVEERILEEHLWKGEAKFIKMMSLNEGKRGQDVSLKDVVSKITTKVCRLAHKKLHAFSRLLDLNSSLASKIWECIEHCLFEKTLLLNDRHLDQIIMCSIYAICKVCQSERKFKHITQAYRKMSHTCATVFKKVKIYQNEDSYDSIIAFYNKAFMQAQKDFILKYSQAHLELDTSERKLCNNSEFNVLKRVNPNSLARITSHKSIVVHPPPASSRSNNRKKSHERAGFCDAPNGNVPLGVVASIVANQFNKTNNRTLGISSFRQNPKPQLKPEHKKVKLSAYAAAASANTANRASDDDSDESSEDEEEARTNRDIYQRMISKIVSR